MEASEGEDCSRLCARRERGAVLLVDRFQWGVRRGCRPFGGGVRWSWEEKVAVKCELVEVATAKDCNFSMLGGLFFV